VDGFCFCFALFYFILFYFFSLLSINLTPQEVCGLLEKKQIIATPIPAAAKPSIHCVVPAHRADVLHAFDIAEVMLERRLLFFFFWLVLLLMHVLFVFPVF
jgi:hypothetical protein